jgi:hypothetical protein
MTIPLAPRTKSSWPLIVLAATSFVPGFGFFLGAAAVTWGLLSDRPRAKLAIVLGGSGALLQVLLIAIIGWRMRDSPEMRQVQTAGAVNDLNAIVLALDEYHTNRKRYPPTLLDLIGRPIPVRFINIYDQTAGLLQQRAYEYRPRPDGLSFDLFSVGPDGVAETEDDLRPSLSDSVLRKAGYRP